MTITAKGLAPLQRVWILNFNALYFDPRLTQAENDKNLTKYINQRTYEHCTKLLQVARKARRRRR